MTDLLCGYLRRPTSVLTVLVAAALAGCASTDGPDYKTAGARTAPLDVPPDLITPTSNDRFTIPQPGQSTTLSEFERTRRQGAGGINPDSKVLRTYDNVSLQRDGQIRWLKVAGLSPEQAWISVRQFWQDSGFVIDTELPEAGLIQTGWAEKREKIADGAIRSALSNIFGNNYSTSQRDAFRSRIEPIDGDGAEIYVTHRGMVEVINSSVDGDTRWQPRPTDPDLEVEFLRRLMVHLGTNEESSQQAAATVKDDDQSLTELTTKDGDNILLIKEPFDRAWRRVGLALDRSGFTVEDRNRSQGTYFVRYIDADQLQEKPGFFARLFGPEEKDESIKYRIVVSSADEHAQVRIDPAEDGNEPVAGTDTARRMLGLINEKLTR